MKAMVRFGALCVFCVAVALGGISCSGGGLISITISMPITLASDLTLDLPEEAPAGFPIPDDYSQFSVPLCDLPTSQDLEQMVIDTAGELLGGLIQLQAIKLTSMTLEATGGDFSSLTSLAVAWQPKPVNDVEQADILLGEAESQDGLSDPLVLTGGDPVDLLQLIEAEEANPAEGCPELNVEIAGTVPETAPVFDVIATVDVTVGI